MTTPRQQRLAGLGWSAGRDSSLIARLLRAIGADPAFTDDVLGDLAHERTRRRDASGAFAGALWYAGQVVRSTPHLAWNAARHGSGESRARFAVLAAGLVLVPVAAVMVLTTLFGGPARLVVEGQRGRSAAEGLIVNSRRPVRLAAKAFDARGRALGTAGVRYSWLGGDPLDVQPNGVITCSREGNASVRASAGRVAATVLVDCRPVQSVKSYRSILLVAGDAPRELPFEARGPSGEWVWELAGERMVADTSIARLERGGIRGLKAGHTEVGIRMGDGTASIKVTVFDPVPSLEGLSGDVGRPVIAPLHVARGSTMHVTLPTGKFWLKYHRGADDEPLPVRRVTGSVSCAPLFGPKTDRVYCIVRAPGAQLHLSAPPRRDVDGRLSLEFDHFLHI